jgi:hypothetical protein
MDYTHMLSITVIITLFLDVSGMMGIIELYHPKSDPFERQQQPQLFS